MVDAAVAVREGMDGLELIMRNRHTDERVGALGLVQVGLPVGQQAADDRLADGRGVHHAAAAGQDRAWQPADGHGMPVDPGADLLGQAGADRQLASP
jgi:hypothetical protein